MEFNMLNLPLFYTGLPEQEAWLLLIQFNNLELMKLFSLIKISWLLLSLFGLIRMLLQRKRLLMNF
jgi:hypothetical protein